MQHPRIVGYEDDFMHTTPQSAGRDAHIYVCIIMELCERDLRQLLELKRDNGAGVSEEQLLKYLAQICSALSYCHGKLIIHRGAPVAPRAAAQVACGAMHSLATTPTRTRAHGRRHQATERVPGRR